MKTKIRSILIVITLLSLGLLPQVQAVSPAPDGGYPGLTTAEGDHALNALTSGLANTAVGWYSLSHVTNGSYNTGVGAGALDLNTGNENTATGVGALLLNTTGANNTANGAFALADNTGDDNTAMGDRALQNNTTGPSNTAIGSGALATNTIGNFNTAVGVEALSSNSTGSFNIALGYLAGVNLTTGSNNIDIGEAGVDGEGGTMRIGFVLTQRAFIRGIRGVTTGNNDAIPVLIDSNGQLGTMSSSRRYKKEIKPMEQASEAILALKPVTFHYKSDKTNRPEFGLIAEEVAAVNPDLTVRDGNGEIYTVRYDAVNAMLLNEFLKEHRAFVEEQCKVQELQKQVEKLTADVQNVSAEIEMSKAATRVAARDP